MWKDIDMELGRKVSGDIKDMEDNDAIQNSITNIFKTLPGSRRMLYPFASPVWGLLFEQVDDVTANEIGRMLLRAIERWEDRINVDNLHIIADPDNNMFVVQLTYTIITENQDVVYFFEDVIVPV